MFNKIFKLFIKNSEDTKNPAVRAAYGKFLNIVCIAFNVLLFAGKVIAGLISGSVAIIADAFNNLSDASSNVVAFFGFKLSNIPADEEHPYGHGRYEYIASLIVAFLIMVIGFELFKTSIEKIITPSQIKFEWVTFIILASSILVKLFMSIFAKVAGKKISSETLMAVSVDSRNDVIATSAVIVSLFTFKLFNFNADGIVGVIVALIILISGIKIIIETVGTLLGKSPDREYVEEIRKKIMSYDTVIGTHDLMVHDYGPGRKFASVHVEMPAENDPLRSHEIIDDMERDFLKDMNLHISVHYDPIYTKDSLVGEMREYISEEFKKVDGKISIHDLRIVRGIERDIALFDIVLPRGVNYAEKEIKEIANNIVSAKYKSFVTNVTIDRDFANFH